MATKNGVANDCCLQSGGNAFKDPPTNSIPEPLIAACNREDRAIPNTLAYKNVGNMCEKSETVETFYTLDDRITPVGISTTSK